jgi:hypothetical protein
MIGGNGPLMLDVCNEHLIAQVSVIYSQRKAAIGSILVALRAGIQQASSTTNIMTQGTTKRTTGSFLLSP